MRRQDREMKNIEDIINTMKNVRFADLPLMATMDILILFR